MKVKVADIDTYIINSKNAKNAKTSKNIKKMRYKFDIVVNILSSFDYYIKNWAKNYTEFSYRGSIQINNKLYIDLDLNDTLELSTSNYNSLQDAVAQYSNPMSWKILNSTVSKNIYSNYTTNEKSDVLQTFIYTKNINYKNNNGIKFIFEYTCNNVLNYLNTNGTVNIKFMLYNINTQSEIIPYTNINTSDVILNWKSLAAQGFTGSSTLYKTILYDNLNIQDDSLLQIHGSVPNNQPFKYKIAGLQYLYYIPVQI